MPVDVRPARPDEADAVAAGYDWLFAPPGQSLPWWDAGRAAAALRALMDDERAEVLVAVDGDEVVGICTVYLDIRSVRFGQRAWVEDLAVHPQRRSQGAGKALLDAAREWARERGATHLELDSALTRTDAHRFYDRERPDAKSLTFSWRL